MMPRFIDIGSIWKVLPPGIHNATLGEIEQRFAITERRMKLFRGFEEGVKSLQKAGCKAVLLDGSFVSNKTIPGDFDALWDPTNVDLKKIDPVLLEFSNGRKKQKSKYFGEFFPSSSKADGRRTFEEYFQIDKETGNPKGIIQVRFS